MSKVIFSHEDLMREIAARSELRLATYEEDRAPAAPTKIVPFDLGSRKILPRHVYRFH